MWTLGASADVVFRLARAREAAGRPFAAVVAAFPTATAVAPERTPLFAIGGIAASIFLCRRGTLDVGPLDLPAGIRIDTRIPTDSSRETSVAVSLQLDLAAVVVGVIAMTALVHGAH